MECNERCTLWPSTGLRVFADGFTVQHVAPGVLRPLTAYCSSSLAHVQGYFEIRIFKGAAVKVGLFDPDGLANKSRAVPLVDDMLISLSSDSGVLLIKTKDGIKRFPCTTFSTGDTIGLGCESSSILSRVQIFITRNGKRVDSYPIVGILAKTPMAMHPIVALAAAGDFVCLDVGRPPPELSVSRGKYHMAGHMVFDSKHFSKNRIGQLITVQKVSKSGMGVVHVKKDLWGLLSHAPPRQYAISAGQAISAMSSACQVSYFEVTFGLIVPPNASDAARSTTSSQRIGKRAESRAASRLNSQVRSESSDGSICSVSSFSSSGMLEGGEGEKLYVGLFQPTCGSEPANQALVISRSSLNDSTFKLSASSGTLFHRGRQYELTLPDDNVQSEAQREKGLYDQTLCQTLPRPSSPSTSRCSSNESTDPSLDLNKWTLDDHEMAGGQEGLLQMPGGKEDVSVAAGGKMVSQSLDRLRCSFSPGELKFPL